MLKLSVSQTITREIADPSFGSFTLLLRRPTAQEIIFDRAAGLGDKYESMFRGRLDCIVGWTDINGQDDKPLPFTRANLDQVLANNVTLCDMVLGTLTQLFNFSLPEDREKNSDVPSQIG